MATKKYKVANPSDIDISDVRLEGQDMDEVPIYMTCEDVRMATEAYLRNTGAS
jgi:hypothetical protein